jgi:hypothetical protein
MASPVASHSCAVESLIVNGESSIFFFMIHVSRLMNAIPNVQVSDTTGDAISNAVGNKNLKIGLEKSSSLPQ